MRISPVDYDTPERPRAASVVLFRVTDPFPVALPAEREGDRERVTGALNWRGSLVCACSTCLGYNPLAE